MANSTVDFIAGERHFLEHLAPIIRAIPDEHRGTVYVTAPVVEFATELGLEPTIIGDVPLRRGPPTVVAAVGDLRRAGNRPVVLCQHGAGQSYSSRHSSYAGGRGYAGVRLFLDPNLDASQRNRRYYPRARFAVIGSPRLDAWLERPAKPAGDRPVVALSFHWRCAVAPEAGTAFDDMGRDLIAELALFAKVTGVEALGHGHPRILDELRPHYDAAGIEVVDTFDEVLERADVYVVDNSSTLFEFAATGRPVVVINAPQYRRTINHGLRFWTAATIGPNVNRALELPDAIIRALERRPDDELLREAGVAAAYAHRDGNASRRAAVAIVNTFSLGARCALCGAAGCRCGGIDGEVAAVELVKAERLAGKPRRYAFAVGVLPTMPAGGELNLKPGEAKRLGVEPDGAALPKALVNRLRRAGATERTLAYLERSYLDLVTEDRQRDALATFAGTKPGPLAAEVQRLNLAVEHDLEELELELEADVDEHQADEDVPPPELPPLINGAPGDDVELEDVPTGRVGDVIAWVDATTDGRKARARAALEVERRADAGRQRATLVTELERRLEED
jgi:hypothetical protein